MWDDTSEHHPWNVFGTSMWVMGPSSGSSGAASDGGSCIDAQRINLRSPMRSGPARQQFQIRHPICGRGWLLCGAWSKATFDDFCAPLNIVWAALDNGDDERTHDLEIFILAHFSAHEPSDPKGPTDPAVHE